MKEQGTFQALTQFCEQSPQSNRPLQFGPTVRVRIGAEGLHETKHFGLFYFDFILHFGLFYFYFIFWIFFLFI